MKRLAMIPSRLLGLALLAAAAPAPAQTSSDWVTRILAATNLPVSVAEAREEGAPQEDVRRVLDVLQRERVPADEAVKVIDEERAARREYGPVDNFGAFVQSKLQQGLRGQDLAAAIRAEHAARGKGKGQGNARDREGSGKAGDQREAERGKAGGRPEEKGIRPEEKGKKPETGGKPEQQPAKPQSR